MVLCGGASRRMGSPKPFVEVGGAPMARRVADALRAGGCTTVVAVGGDAAALATIGLPHVVDRWPGEGPLGAVATALAEGARLGVGRVVVAPCDLPFLTSASVSTLLGSPSAVVVAAADRVQPLLSAWDPAQLSALEAEFTAGERRILSVLDRLAGVERVEVAAADLVNVNHPGDLPQ
ncbi:MAG: molybdenum cofactor guanylyltransferase [Ilumatobacteraceae bacterium]